MSARHRPICGALLLGQALLLTGCDESVDLGHPPPVLVQTDRRVVPLASGRERLHRAIVALADGNPARVRATIRSGSSRQAEAARRTLVALGVDPARIRDIAGPGSAIELTRAVALTAPCASAIEPTFWGDPGPSLRSLADCNQTNNLAHMVADPADLVAPPPLGPGDGTYLADGVHNWQVSGQANDKQQPGSRDTASTNTTSSAASTTRMP